MTGPPGPDGPRGYKGEKVNKYFNALSHVLIALLTITLQGKCCLYAPTGYPVSAN